MAWDPTDYKDMLDDDWNDRHEEIKDYLVSLIEGGDHKVANLTVANILGNDKVIKDKTFSHMINTGFYMEDVKDIAKYLMDHFYLTPIARKRAKMKMQENKSPRMKKLVKEELRPDYYPDIEDKWKSEHEPWTKNPETNEAMERMLDEYEKINSLDETDYDIVFQIKWALWIGYNFKKAPTSSSGPIPPPKGDMDPRSWGDKDTEWGRPGWGEMGG